MAERQGQTTDVKMASMLAVARVAKWVETPAVLSVATKAVEMGAKMAA